MGPKRNAVKRKNAQPKPKPKPKSKSKSKKAKAKKRSKSRERKKRVEKTNKIAKQHKQKLLNAKRERQRHRNIQMMRLRRRIQAKQSDRKAKLEKEKAGGEAKSKDLEEVEEDDIMLTNQHLKEDSCFRRLLMHIEDCFSGLLYLLTVTMHSERAFDWLVFLANNLGLYQEYEINDYGQRLSPRTGRPVLLSLGPLRVVQIVESANQVRSHWDPYIRDYLRNSSLTTDCWRANRMALQVALCMDDAGTMFDMPLDKGDDD